MCNWPSHGLVLWFARRSSAVRGGLRNRLLVQAPGLAAVLFIWAQAVTAAELHTAEQVRALPAQEAERGLPVQLKGVVTFFDEALFSRFVQDETAGIYLKLSANLPALTAGQIVEIEGVTSAGEYAPVIVPQKVRIIGDGALPSARQVSFERLASGEEDSQFVEVVGIVRSVYTEEPSGRLVLEIATGGGRLNAYVRDLPLASAESIVDSVVRARGVCSTVFNRQRQLFNIHLMVPRLGDLVIEQPAPSQPFAVPTRALGSLLQFTPQGTYGHRVKVAGTVTYQQKGSALFIQDESKGLYIRSRQGTVLQPGDRIEALGFPAQGEYSPVLEDAVYRKVGAGAPLNADDITVDDALKGTHDCQLVRLQGLLLDRAGQAHGQFLVIESGTFLFHALLERAEGPAVFARVPNGSRVAVTGVCLIEPGEWQAGETWRARSFHLLLRSRSDVAVIQPPSWWTLRRLLWLAAGLVVIVLGAFAWVGVLRRRVQKQTEVIRQKLQAEAALKERYEVLFENANDMVFTLDLTGGITSLNKSGEQLLQRRRQDLLGRKLVELLPEDQHGAATQWLGEVAKDGESATAEWDFVNAGGQRIKLEISTRMIDRDGRPAELEGIARDITERRRLEREILEISNREQRRIGHDLHDGVCQELAGIAYRLATVSDRLQHQAPVEPGEVEQIGRLVNEANSQARTVARGLFPVRLEENGLPAALQELVDGIGRRFKIACRFTCQAPPVAVDNEVAIHLYFIAQEGLLNAVKHGQAAHVDLSLAPVGEQFELKVQDDGRGFQGSGASRAGMGIRIMRYRARVIGATLELSSQPGRGTRITCVFSPVSRENSHSIGK